MSNKENFSVTAFGRDVQAAVDSHDSAAAQAVKAVVQWFADDSYMDSQWNVIVETDETGCSVTFARTEAVYEAPVFPSTFSPAWDAYASQEARPYADPEADAQPEAETPPAA